MEGLDAGIHLDSPTRQKIDLSGIWQYSQNEETWDDIMTPSSIDAEQHMVFRRPLKLDETILNNYVLKFVALGINNECEVYINDVFIGKHIGGYTSFEFEIPDDVLQVGRDNSIKVVVNNQLNALTTLPVRKQIWGWKNYGGILRDVYLLATPRVWLDQVRVRTLFDKNDLVRATIHISGTVCNRFSVPAHDDSLSRKQKTISYAVRAELHERFSDILIAQGISAPFAVESNKNVDVQLDVIAQALKLWNPENPSLYILKMEIVAGEGKQPAAIDQYNMNMGFSSVYGENGSLYLNGNKIILKGVVWHEDSPKYGASLSYEQMEKDIVLIKSLGANAVRFAFHPPHPYMLNLCSRYGLLALIELPVWNVPSGVLNQEPFQLLVETQARELVESSGHFPCIAAWGIGDQFDTADEEAAGFIQHIKGTIRQLDDRPVYFGTRMIQNDACAAMVDFVGLMLPPVELKEYKQLLSLWKKKHPGQPLILLGYGKQVEQGNRNGYSDPRSEESQARYYIQYYAALKEAKAAGSFTAALADWRGDRPVLGNPSGDPYLHPVGLLSHSREKRLAFEVVRALYNEERISAIPAGTYRANFPWAHVLIGLFVILLIAYESTNRRFGECLKRSLIRSYNFFVDLRDLRTVSIFHTFILSGAISLTLACLFSSILYHYRTDTFADYILTYFFVWDALKVRFIHLTWHPLSGIGLLTGFFFIMGILTATCIKVCAWVVRLHVTWIHVYSVFVWSAAPAVFLSPLAMSLFKIMENPVYVLPSLLIILLFLIWTFFRILKGISVMYERPLVKTYASGIFVCLLLLGGLFFYYESVFGLSSYVKFIIHLAQNLG